jgi:S1-C subfamily serine protease
MKTIRWMRWSPMLCLLLVGCAARDGVAPPGIAGRQLRTTQPAAHHNQARTVDARDLEDAEAARLAQVATSIAPAIVYISSELEATTDGADDASDASQPARTRSGGTGVILSSRAVLTNEHVTRDAHRLTVVTADGTVHSVERVLIDEALDLALLRVAGELPNVLAAPVDSAEVGAAVVALGGRSGHTPEGWRAGVVTDVRASLQSQLDPSGKRDYSRLVAATTRLEPGFSGGPLVDTQGCLVGLNVAVAGRPEDRTFRGYAIPFDERTREAVEQLLGQVEAEGPRLASHEGE